MDHPYPWLQDFIDQVPEILQPIMVALVAAIPYVEGEGAVTLGIIAGITPIVAALAAIAGNVLCVIAVVTLGSQIRAGIMARRAARAPAPDSGSVASGDAEPSDSKGQSKLRRWWLKFGLPGASILAPVALPTMLTAAFFVASGAPKRWVILWQVVAIVLWTGAVAVVVTGLLALLGW